MKFDVRSEQITHVWHKWRGPGTAKRLLDTLRRSEMPGPEANRRPAGEQRLEKWQATNVIEVSVAEKNIGGHRLPKGGQRGAQTTNAAATVQDQQVRTTPYLHAKRVATVTHG